MNYFFKFIFDIDRIESEVNFYGFFNWKYVVI